MFTSPQWPVYSDEEINVVAEILRSGKTNQWRGDNVRSFEKEFAELIGAKHCVAVANGSLALEAAWRAIGLKLGDEVIVTPRSFIASASSIVMQNATPVFVDVDETTQNIAPAAVEAAITSKTKAVLCVHHAGCPCDMDAIILIAKNHGLKVVEDCAQATGARFRGRHVGTIGDIGCFSFCQDKIFTTGGEGGMVSSNDAILNDKIWSLKDHGRNPVKIAKLKQSPDFPYFCDSIGSNWRMTEMQAAIGRSFLKKVNGWINIRRRNAYILDNLFKKYPFIRVPQYPDHLFHPFYEYYVFTVPERFPAGWDTRRLISQLQLEGISCNRGSCPEIYREEAFSEIIQADETIIHPRPAQRLPIAHNLGETSMKFLVHPGFTVNIMNQMVGIIQSVMEKIK